MFHPNAEIESLKVSFAYDPYFPRLTQMEDGIGTTTYACNEVDGEPGAGMLAEIDGPFPDDDITFHYDELGRTTGTLINGVGASRQFDDLGRVTEVENPLGTFEFKYDGDLSRVLSVQASTGHKTTYGYHENGWPGFRRLKTIDNRAPGNVPLSKFQYGYDENGSGMITSWSQQAGTDTPAVWTYEYDTANQLTGAVKTVGSDIVKRYYYGYDAMGNRTNEQVDNTVTTGVFNNLNQLTDRINGGKIRVGGEISEPGRVHAGGQEIDVEAWTNEFRGSAALDAGTTESLEIEAEDYSGNTAETSVTFHVENGDQKVYEYDLNGNTTKIATYPADGGSSTTMEFEWDAKDQMVAIVQSDGRRSEFVYDGYGRRAKIVEKELGDLVSRRSFVWLGYQIAEQRGSDGSGVSKRFFGVGEQRDGSTNLYYAKDHLGSIRQLTDESGSIGAWYEYAPFGESTKVEGMLDTDFRFTGHYYHATSGLHLAPFRGYGAEEGRWVSRDPIQESDDINLYRYAMSSPTTFYDTLGLWGSRWGFEDHQDSIDRAIGNRLSAEELRILRYAVKDADMPEYQTPEMSYRHAMRGCGETVDEAKAKANDFVREKIRLARLHMAAAASERPSMNWQVEGSAYRERRRIALIHLGHAIHAVQDHTSPSHRYFQPWCHPSAVGVLGHFHKEFEPSFLHERSMDRATSFLHDVYEDPELDLNAIDFFPREVY